MIRGGFAVNVPSGSDANRNNLASWDVAVRQAALQEMDRGRVEAGVAYAFGAPLFVDTPLSVSIVFRMRAPKKRHAAPMTKPDIDKLARATLDALHGSIFDDDSRVVELALVKTYAAPGREGARIVIKAWSDQHELRCDETRAGVGA